VNDDLEGCVARVLAILEGEREGGGAELRRRFDPARALARLRAGALPPPAGRVH
jgi:hypothetical protein